MENLKIDLHIHTSSYQNHKDRIEFDMEALVKHVESNELDIIAITNHDFFDQAQFILIDEEFKKRQLKCKILPGIEISAKGYHILVISWKLSPDFIASCEEIRNVNINKEEGIETKRIIELFNKQQEIIYIPHYEKKPSITRNKVDLDSYGDLIKMVEVSNFKYFNKIKKEDKYCPVIFSDFRAEKNSSPAKEKKTFIKFKKENIKQFKDFDNLLSLPKLFNHSPNESINFELPHTKAMISEDKNIILGLRASGKTTVLDEINSLFSGDEFSVKYIKQFEISKNAESIDKNEESSYSTRFNNQFKMMIDKKWKDNLSSIINSILEVGEFNLEENQMNTYVEQLISYSESSAAKELLQLPIVNSNFNSVLNITIENVKDAYKKISDFSLLQENEISEIKFILSENNISIDINNINSTKGDLEDLYKKIKYEEEVQNIFIEIRDEVKSELESQSEIEAPIEIDIDKIMKAICLEEKTRRLFEEINYENIVLKEEKVSSKFKTSSYIKRNKSATEAKKNISVKSSISNIWSTFVSDNNLYKLVVSWQEKRLDTSKIPDALFTSGTDFLTSDGDGLSGGQKSELYLLLEIKDADKYDFLLIDEPESSFDNIFLTNDLFEMIKEIRDTTIVLSTHNSNLANKFFSENIVVAEKDTAGDYTTYSGMMLNKMLTNHDNLKQVNTHEKILDILEAGINNYNEKGENYEKIK